MVPSEQEKDLNQPAVEIVHTTQDSNFVALIRSKPNKDLIQLAVGPVHTNHHSAFAALELS